MGEIDEVDRLVGALFDDRAVGAADAQGPEDRRGDDVQPQQSGEPPGEPLQVMPRRPPDRNEIGPVGHEEVADAGDAEPDKLERAPQRKSEGAPTGDPRGIEQWTPERDGDGGK